jgi:hypothetical protein
LEGSVTLIFFWENKLENVERTVIRNNTFRCSGFFGSFSLEQNRAKRPIMTTLIKTWLDQFSPQAQAAIIAAIIGLIAGCVGPAVKHFWDRWSLRHRLRTEHEYSERKKLRELISKYHGRILESAESLNHRLWNLRKNENKGWLKLHGNFLEVETHYYFRTTIYRFLAFLGQLKEFQDEAVYIDARIAEKTDILFLMYAKALEWTLTDVSLFEGLPYDPNHATDHLFKGHIRVACEVCLEDNGKFSLLEFENRLKKGHFLEELRPLYRFFDGLCADGSLRWDRVVAFHLLLCSFINTFGYPVQRTTREQIGEIGQSIRHQKVLTNLLDWWKSLGVSVHKEGKQVVRQLKSILRSAPSTLIDGASDSASTTVPPA